MTTPAPLPDPKAVYVAFEVFPCPKGASSHIGSMVSALAAQFGPVWLLSCGVGDMPAVQVEGDVVVLRHRAEEPNMLARARGFAAFVHETCAGLPPGVEVCVFRDPWGGGAALQSGLDSRFVFEVNALPSWELGYRYPAWRGAHATREKLRDVERFCLAEADAVLVVSDVTADALAELGVAPARIHRVTNAARDVFFEADPARAALPDGPDLTGGRWVVYVGSLHRWQGVEVAAEAWALVEADLPDVQLLVVHSGRKRPFKRLRRAAERLGAGVGERLHFHLPLSHEELAPVLARADLSLAPLVETLRNCKQGCNPVKVIESMAAGTPVLASDLRVTRDLIRDGEDGWLVPPGDPRRLALAMRRALRDRGACRRLGRAAREAARARFTWDHVHAAMAPVFAGGGRA